MNFKDFLCENKNYLAQQIGTVLSATQDLEQNTQMSNRDYLKHSAKIRDQIRQLIRNRWQDSEIKFVKMLQKPACALAKTIDNKENLKELIPEVSKSLAEIIEKMGVPINNLTPPSEETE